MEMTEPGRALVQRRRLERAEALTELLAELDAEDQAAITVALPALARLVEARNPA